MEENTHSNSVLERSWVRQIVRAIRTAEDAGTPAIDLSALRPARSRLEAAVQRALLSEFNARVLADGRGPTHVTPMSARILRALDERACTAGFRVTSVARDLRVSVSTLERRIKAETGSTIRAHVQRVRVSKAKQLLMDTQLSIKEIAAMVGYGSASVMNERFRSATGVTPTAFRLAGS